MFFFSYTHLTLEHTFFFQYLESLKVQTKEVAFVSGHL
jgi:hypothetical protein